PLVLGGVDWRSVLMTTASQANAVLLGIAAGLYASTRGGSTIQVMVLAEGLALGLAVFLNFILAPLSWVMAGGPRGPAWLVVFAGMSGCCSVALFILILYASVRRLRATWQDESPASEQPRWVKIFSSSEFWRSFFRWDTSRTLDRNPMAWLQEYSWTARLTKWGWLAVVLLTEFILLTGSIVSRSSSGQPLLTVALGLGIAFSAVGSFRREQESGLLELLLVTPLSVRQLLGGRFWGICCHYLPALAVLWVGWMGDRALNPMRFGNGFMAAMVPHPVAFLLLIVLGLYLSLSRLNFFLAWLLTWAIGFAVPIIGRTGLDRFTGADPWVAFGLSLTFQLTLAALMWFLLYRKVRQREFAVVKGDRNVVV
ncbi:MAG: hypothetical protein NT154_07885, partial [Verrucomicrobia bacterium]|nr:hypothetical protein [Verrucomicrobiota bacterium]